MPSLKSLRFASPTKRAKVHGVLTSVSQMQTPISGKKSYFHAQLSDDSTSVRVVGFESSQQEQLASKYDTQQPITLEGCELKKVHVRGPAVGDNGEARHQD